MNIKKSEKNFKDFLSEFFSSKKNIAIFAAAVAVLIALVCVIVFAVSHKQKENRVDEYLNQRFETYGEMNIIADAAVVDGKSNTLAGIKEAARLGADTVTLDLCFNSDDVPLVCSDYDDISKDTLKLEDAFKLLNEEKYLTLRLNLRIKQLGSLEKFNGLIAAYNMSGRVILSGIDKNRYGLISGESTAAGLFFDYEPKLKAAKSLNEILDMQEKYGISGVIIKSTDITEELASKLNQRGIVFIVGGADEEMDMYSALSSGAGNIQTAYPDKLNELCKKWKESTREKIEKSILDELNNPKENKEHKNGGKN